MSDQGQGQEQGLELLDGRRNYREESELRERVADSIDWASVTPLSRRVFLATYFPQHPRLHVVLDTFQDYRVAFFRQPHRIDHHCHLQTLHVQGGHLRQILGFLTSLAKYRKLRSTSAWDRLRRVPDNVHEMQLCGASADEIYEEVLERHILPFLRATRTFPNLFRLVMQTHYSDHNRLTRPDEIAQTQQMLAGLIDYIYLPRSIELDVWSEDLLDELQRRGMTEEALTHVRPKRQLVVTPIEGRARPETVAELTEIAAYTERLRTGQLLELTRRLTDERFFRAVLERYAMRLDPAVEDFIERWTHVFLAYYDHPDVAGSVNPVTISNKALQLFVAGMAEREAQRDDWSLAKRTLFREQIARFLPKAKSLMKDTFAISKRYHPYLDVIRRFHGECLVFEAHPAAEHFATATLTNERLLDIMVPTYRVAADAGLTGLEVNRGEAFNEVVLEAAERLDLHLSVASDFHSLSLSRAKSLKKDREYGCARNIPAVLFKFPNLREPVTLTPIEVARSIGRLVGQPIPDEVYRLGYRRRPRTLWTEQREGDVVEPAALVIARKLCPRYRLPEALEARAWSLARALDQRYQREEGIRAGAVEALMEVLLRTQNPYSEEGDTPEEVALANSIFHGVRALELLQDLLEERDEPAPKLSLAVGTLLHDVSRAYGVREDALLTDDYDSDDYDAHKAIEQEHSTTIARRVLHDVLFPQEHHAAVLFLVSNHERGAHVKEVAVQRAKVGEPAAEMLRSCRLIDLADALVFFEPANLDRYLRRRGETRLQQKIAYTLDLPDDDRAAATARARRLGRAGSYSPEATALLDRVLI